MHASGYPTCFAIDIFSCHCIMLACGIGWKNSLFNVVYTRARLCARSNCRSISRPSWIACRLMLKCFLSFPLVNISIAADYDPDGSSKLYLTTAEEESLGERRYFSGPSSPTDCQISPPQR